MYQNIALAMVLVGLLVGSTYISDKLGVRCIYSEIKREIRWFKFKRSLKKG